MTHIVEKYLGVTINIDDNVVNEYNSNGRNAMAEIKSAIASSLTEREVLILKEQTDLTSEEINIIEELEKKFGENT